MDIQRPTTIENPKQWDIVSIDIHPAKLSDWGINPNFLVPFVEKLRKEGKRFESEEQLITFSDLKTIVAWLHEKGYDTKDLNAAIKDALEQQPQVSLAEFKSHVRSIYNNNPIVVRDDLQKYRWGGRREANGKILTAIVKPSSVPGFYLIDAIVKSNDTNNPLKGRVAFFVHDSFSEEIRYAEVKKGVATTRIGQCYEAFTLGAYVEDGTRLELDLNETSYPESFFGNNPTEFQYKVQELYAQKPVNDPEDLQKNRWGGVASKNGKTLSASVRKSNMHGLFTITLYLRSEFAEQFNGEVAFFLHNNFSRKIRFARIKNGKAELRFHSDKFFTVGACTEDGTELELDINAVASYPKGFYYDDGRLPLLIGYGILKGKASASLRATVQSEHYQILINHGNDPHRIAINTKSSEAPSQVLYYASDDFHHEITNALEQADLAVGFTALESKPGGLALDFIRRNLFDRAEMIPLPSRNLGDNDELNDRLDFFVQQAIRDDSAVVYAFGQHRKDNSGKDKYFNEINPSFGIHDIHMNQGNPAGKFFGDNGVWQDGGLLFHFASRNRWAAVFTAFESQSFHTDDVHGNPITEPHPPDQSTANIRIIAAMVNPKGEEPGKEYVILLNKTNQDINLSGWQIVDKLKKSDIIGNQVIPAGDTLRIKLTGQGAQLSNKGGNITLLNKEQVKIDGVTYTKEDASIEDKLVEF